MASVMKSESTKFSFGSLMESSLNYPFSSKWLSATLSTLIVLSILGSGLVAATNPSKPGDFGFFIDRGFEKLRVNTHLSSSARFKYKSLIAEERLAELMQFELDDVEGLLSSLDELEISLIDLRSEVAKVKQLSKAQDSAQKITDNLLDLVARYRAFLLGDATDTEEIQKQLDESTKDINKIVDTASQSSPADSAQLQSVEPATPSNPAPASQPATPKTPTPTPTVDVCNTSYQNLGNEIEKEEVILKKNTCDEYTVSFGGTTYVLQGVENIDYAVGKEVKIHGESGTNDSIFVTEFELDD